LSLTEICFIKIVRDRKHPHPPQEGREREKRKKWKKLRKMKLWEKKR